ncbi:MAG TPA: hypothetical protein VHA52_03830 [Candidatus Babeliaceae bacterium]|nr:hypothetical protein [Candidatus Babeliaceae bacterium]
MKRQTTSYIDGLSALLERNGSIKHADTKALKKMFGQSSLATFEDFLLEENLVDKSDLLEALSEYYQVPAVDLLSQFLDHHLVTMFPVDLMVRKGFVPFQRDENILIIVASNPHDDTLSETLGRYVSYQTTFWVGILQDIIDMAREYTDTSITQEPQDIDRNTESQEEKLVHRISEDTWE